MCISQRASNSFTVEVVTPCLNPTVWTPEAFEYPDITPCPYALHDVKPVPYRPFRWGEYYVTMGIRTMPWNEWIELDESFSFHQRIRNFRVRKCGETVLRVLPPREEDPIAVAGGAEAAKELLYELVEYLHRRYPLVFRISRLSASSSVPSIGGIPLAWDGQMPIKTIEVVETGAKYDLGVLESMSGVEMGEEALRIVNGLTQDDIAIMIEGSDGMYYFQAGLICVPGFWRMRDKIGLPLAEIHCEVPQFKEKLQLGMNRFFKRLPLDKPVIRNNYSIQIVKLFKVPEATHKPRLDVEEEILSDIDPEELSWSESLNGPEDDFAHGRSYGTGYVPQVDPSTLRLRSERQSLRRLPRTGAIVFGIRTYQFKVAELAQERGVAGRLASAVRSWPDDVAFYKGRRRYRDVLLAYLDECADKDGTGPTESMLPYPY
ncbi:hypothetical protein PAXRUDRAFT_833621 [Paxillus rubicundulus Ve08.2h10]|uniref:Uncharacterized protein n=1 Tax=Paxillus rubicundulus Ve08.2h10 TaxID=930991 RepID=A0A0D0CXH8_9AGAM|nr:hypothetical protein PAXRUDRAFT_833621 [Paxillus rubicundulus Ve08.2h10]